MPSLLLEIGAEELPAAACYEAEAQLPELVRAHLGVAPSELFIGPRRIAFLAEDVPGRTADEWVKGPPEDLRERAATRLSLTTQLWPASHRRVRQPASCGRWASAATRAGCSGAVANGGHGTVIKALAYGIPLVCIPQGADQFDNAARVVARGAGLRISRRAGTAALRAAIRRVVEEPHFRENARRIAAGIAEELREEHAVEELEELAGRARSVGAPVL